MCPTQKKQVFVKGFDLPQGCILKVACGLSVRNESTNDKRGLWIIQSIGVWFSDLSPH